MTFKSILVALLFACSGLAGEWFPVTVEAPSYPALANQARIEGVVRLKLTIASDGRVMRAQVLSGNSILAQAAEANILTWKFSQPCSEGAKAGSMEFTYQFKLQVESSSIATTGFRYEQPYKAIVTSQAKHWMPEANSGKSRRGE